MDIKYHITDNDGVNADSETLAMRVMDDEGTALVKRFNPGAQIEPNFIYRTYAGVSTNKTVEKLILDFKLDETAICADYGIPADENAADYIANMITAETIRRFKEELTTIPGAVRAKRGIQDILGKENTALATTSREDRMDVTLERALDVASGQRGELAALYPKGERRISGYGHSNKYALAIGQLGWDPKLCCVTEDSQYGVERAKQAGIEFAIGTVAAAFFEDKAAQAANLVNAGADIVISNAVDEARALRWLKTDLDPAQMPDFVGTVYLPNPDALGMEQEGARVGLRTIQPSFS